MSTEERAKALRDKLALLDEGDIPQPDSIISHECMYSHAEDISPEGLYICLETFNCYSSKFGQLCNEYKKKCEQGGIFLRIRRTAENATIKKMALNIEDGVKWHHSACYAYKELIEILVMPEDFTYALDDPVLSQADLRLINKYITAIQEASERRFPSWVEDDLELFTGKFDQISNDCPPNLDNSMCAKCDATTGLWLNLADGYIGCGKECNGHSLEHFVEKKYPLVVRIGSITSAGGGDVYSYYHKSLVIHKTLLDHLNALKVDLNSLPSSSATSISELEWQWNRQVEVAPRPVFRPPGCSLEFVCGPGLTGLLNPHQMCYMHCVVQVLRHVSTAIKRFDYSEKSLSVRYAKSAKFYPSKNVITQMIKLISDLSSSEYSQTPKSGISGLMFKDAIARGHPKFSTSDQQCVLSYMVHLATTLDQEGYRELWNSLIFTIKMENEFKDSSIKCSDQLFVCINFELSAVVYPEYCGIVTMNQFLQKYFETRVLKVEGSEDNSETVKQRKGFATFPDILLICPGGKKYPSDNNNFDKMQVTFKVDEEINLNCFKFTQSEGRSQKPVPASIIDQPVQRSEIDAKIDKMVNDSTNDTITRHVARMALSNANEDIDRAWDWYYENKDSVQRVIKKVDSVEESKKSIIDDKGDCKYRLWAVIDHIGDKVNSGHAVVYVRKAASEEDLKKERLLLSALGLASPPSSTSDSIAYRWFQFDDHFVSLVINTEKPHETHLMPPVKMAQTYIYVLDKECK